MLARSQRPVQIANDRPIVAVDGGVRDANEPARSGGVSDFGALSALRTRSTRHGTVGSLPSPPPLYYLPAVDPRHMRDVRRQLLRAMRCQHPVVSAARTFQCSSQFFARTRVETIENLVEQQHASTPRERASNQCQATLSVRQRQHASSSQTVQTESLQHAGHALALSTRGLSQRDVFVEEPRSSPPARRSGPSRSAHIYPGAPGRRTRSAPCRGGYAGARGLSASATHRRGAFSGGTSCPSRSDRSAPSARLDARRSRSRRARRARRGSESNATAR